MTDWVRRAYNPDWDEAVVEYMWLKSYCHSKPGTNFGATVDESDEEIAFIEAHRPLVRWCLENGTTEVICDPERSEPSKLGDPIVWAFACTSDNNVVHYAMAKRSVVKVGLSGEMLKELLGPKLYRPCFYTWEQIELTAKRCEKHGIARPELWRPHMTWLAVHTKGLVL